MKVIAFNGSPRIKGNTSILIKQVFEELNKQDIDTELINITLSQLAGCKACGQCYGKGRCVIENDALNHYLEKMIEADGIILASPVYFSNVTPELKALIDRVGFVSLSNGNLLKRKVGAAVIAVRRAGATSVLSDINYFFHINQMIVPGSSYWNMGFGLSEGDVMNDKEGLDTMQHLGENVAWLLKKIKN